MIKKTLLVLIIALLAATTSQAVPRLQIYIPGGHYDAATETWTTNSSTHEVWVVAADLHLGGIYDIGLVASIGDADPYGGSMTVTPFGGSSTTYSGSDFAYGIPPVSDPLPSHGEYPANYIDVSVASRTSLFPIYPVPNFEPGSSDFSWFGQIYRFTVSTTYSSVHYDAYGYIRQNHQWNRIFAPPSHDGAFSSDGGFHAATPEPATLVLLGLGLAGAGIVRRVKNKF